MAPVHLVSFRIALWAAWLWLLTGCGEWVPRAKPAQPELLLEGSFRVDTVLDARQRFVLVTRDPAARAPQKLLVERRPKKVCELPPNTRRVDDALFDQGRAEGEPLFLLPIIVEESDERDRELYYADERCELRGPFGRSDRSDPIIPYPLLAAVSLVDDGHGTLSVVDPWREEVIVIAEGVSQHRWVPRFTSNPRAPEVDALWLIEQGVLTQRALTGERLLSLGANVQTFALEQYDTLRVAYVDDGALYEAAGPNFFPVLIAEDACEPRYDEFYLNFFAPCEERQLVRLDLTTGELELFEPGMLWTYEQFLFRFEYIQRDGTLEMYVTSPIGERMEVRPPLVDFVQVVGPQNIVGRTEDGEFRLWSTNHGGIPLVARAGRPLAFVDTRSREPLWLLPHDIEGQLSTLSLFRRSDLTQEVLARNVPTAGFSVEFIVQVSEPTLVFIENATQVSEQDTRLRGKLRARLSSGDIGTDIDDDVTSYVSVSTPLPGLLYSVEDGSRSGLWFAAF